MARLDLEKIRSGLAGLRIGTEIDYVEELPSTMDRARERLPSPGYLIIAEAQTAGRGKRGAVWESPRGEDLYFSFLTGPLDQRASPFAITLAVGLGIAEAVEALTGVEALVKWPNDVRLKERKIAGILVESNGDFSEGVVVGVGLNVNRRTFPDELREKASSLALITERRFEREEVLLRLLQKVDARIREFEERGPGHIVRALNERLALLNQRVRIGELIGRVYGVSGSGALMIESDGVITEIVAGTVEPIV